MLYVPPAIWSASSVDADVRLWVPFTGNVSTDISSYALGTGTATNATITGGQFTQVAGATVQKIVWGPSTSLARSAQPWTLEAFMTWTSSDNAVDPGGDLEYDVGGYLYRFCLYANLGKVALETSDFGSPNAGPSSGNVLSGTGKTHCALVHPAGSVAQTIRVYVGGTQVLTYLELAGHTGSTGTVTIGNIQGGASGVIAIDDVRLSFLERYTGTSFTPPTSPLT